MIELLPGTGSGDPPPPTPPAGAEGERFPRDEDEYLNTSEDIEAGKKVMSLHKELGAAEGEGEGEYFFCQGEYDGNEKCGAICSICSGHPLLSQLAAAQTRIAALEAELSRQISLKDHCLITMDDMKKAQEKVESQLSAASDRILSLEEDLERDHSAYDQSHLYP